MADTKMLLMRWGFSLLFGAVGLYLVSVTLRLIVRRRDWKLRAIPAEGTIVAFVNETAAGERADRPYIAPVITFTTSSGEPIRFQSSTSVRPNPYVLGRRVAVRYLPEDPSGADMESSSSAWMPIVVVIILATVALTIAMLPFVLGPPTPRP